MEFDIVEWFKAVFLGIVEGITEWLPISSTGHMILVDEFIKMDISEEFKALFLVVIQLGAILAVVMLYFKRLWPFSARERYFICKDKFSMWFKIFVACIPAGVIGILFDDQIDELLMKPIVVVVTLILYGFIFIVLEKKKIGERPRVESIPGCPQDRHISAFGAGSGNFPFRCHDYRRNADRLREASRRRIYFFPCGSGHGGCKPDQKCEIRDGEWIFFKRQ